VDTWRLFDCGVNEMMGRDGRASERQSVVLAVDRTTQLLNDKTRGGDNESIQSLRARQRRSSTEHRTQSDGASSLSCSCVCVCGLRERRRLDALITTSSWNSSSSAVTAANGKSWVTSVMDCIRQSSIHARRVDSTDWLQGDYGRLIGACPAQSPSSLIHRRSYSTTPTVLARSVSPDRGVIRRLPGWDWSAPVCKNARMSSRRGIHWVVWECGVGVRVSEL